MLIETEVPELDEDILYEACVCFDRDPIAEGGCMTCWDMQIVPHTCGEDDE
jgi:hypothetical protein